ncbi:hypothetical protein AWW67_12665 [Roseivirga seohaensis]|uniref:Uncharacterized protein n=1 Tax=Roseivirga seohaensis TaxID=1914963 RepID=A0A150XKF9_9BACT|nr:hypothetical protein [Roseivirga seohaensis]KYG79227.1 hypothetical protein AWW67_12665 [Roseivirga seohaensis]|tara:strand:+ start:1226 stop:1912 length:687 start_codon:yes stop_codon:yes gene_type:complete
MKKLFRILAVIFLTLILGLFVFYLVKNESLPEGTAGSKADNLALEMMESLNKSAWDSTANVSWTFKGIHHYEWNRTENSVLVKWDENEVLLNTINQTGEVIRPEKIREEGKEELIKQAFGYFNNDSFWLCAPFKAFDPGTERSLVTLKDGREGLKVTYTSGGSTPGDSYVWILDENNKPKSVKMWVSILPLGGMEFTWENYLKLSSGALVAQDHILYNGININIDNLK